MNRDKRLTRLLKLVHLLQSGDFQNADSLSLQVSVSRRTIFRDLTALNAAGFPVLFDEARGGYFCPASWRLPIDPLTPAEAMTLLLICHELGRSEGGLPFFSAARSAAHKISLSLPSDLQAFVQEVLESSEIHLDPHNPLVDSSGVYSQLLEAWLQRRQVRIEYESATERTTIATLLCPYRFMFSRRSWYVIGKSSRDRAVRTFNMGRITSLRLLDGQYQVPRRFSLTQYLGDAWHLIREPGERHTVVVRFLPLVAQNVAEVRWHRTQTCEWLADGSLKFQVSVEGLNEISWWIQGYGDQAEVLAPPQLRTMLRQRLARAWQQYAVDDANSG